MLSRYVMALVLVLGSSYLWLSAIEQLANQPVTHTGTQPYHQVRH